MCFVFGSPSRPDAPREIFFGRFLSP
jgi:hypothetical protein